MDRHSDIPHRYNSSLTTVYWKKTIKNNADTREINFNYQVI